VKIQTDDHDWYRAVLKVNHLRLPAGRIIAVARTRLRHSIGGCGPTWWLLSPEDEALYQVADTYFGSSLSQLVKIERRVRDDELCRRLALKYAEGGQYGRAKSREIKHLLPNRRNADKR
jgi:hypothetical protein